MKQAIGASILLIVIAGPALAQTRQQTIDAGCLTHGARGSSPYLECALKANQVIQYLGPQCTALGIRENDRRFGPCIESAAKIAKDRAEQQERDRVVREFKAWSAGQRQQEAQQKAEDRANAWATLGQSLQLLGNSGPSNLPPGAYRTGPVIVGCTQMGYQTNCTAQ